MYFKCIYIMGNQKNTIKATKRKKIFCVSNKQLEDVPYNLRSRKIKKRKLVDESLDKERYVDSDNYNLIINFTLLKDFLNSILFCPECNSKNVEIIDELSLRMDYAHKLNLNCHDCPYSNWSITSPECAQSENIQGRHKFEINVLAVIAFREVGKGQESMTNVSRCLNMFSITETTSHALNNSLCKAYYDVASTSMQEAVSDIKATSNDKTKPNNCRVSIDGTWQKRGFSSFNGVVTAINRGRCIDVHVMSKS